MMGGGSDLISELFPLWTPVFRVSLSFFICKMELSVPSLTISQSCCEEQIRYKKCTWKHFVNCEMLCKCNWLFFHLKDIVFLVSHQNSAGLPIFVKGLTAFCVMNVHGGIMA